ncbi:competence protein ComK [Bacillus sp. 1P10SD]|uniref:competence protein ComK n=1 Tax=Bacillus sp. 1P10SD TaxID=3132265 RepID=UPI0039A68ED1
MKQKLIPKELGSLKQKIIEEYEANSCTMSIQPVEYGSKIYSLIYETDGEFLSPFKPFEIIKHSCEFYGSDYQSRRRLTKDLTNFTRKAPLVVEPINDIFFFPTASPESSVCMWFSPSLIENYWPAPGVKTKVLFLNKQTLLFDVPYITFNKQMERTSHVKTRYLQRLERKGNKKTFYLINKPKVVKASETQREYTNHIKTPNPK